MIRDPILVPCEGSGAAATHWLCPMCGIPHGLVEGATIPAHNRRDILAELRRGDYDYKRPK